MTNRFLHNIRSISQELIESMSWHQARRALIDYLCLTVAGTKVSLEKELVYYDSLCETGDSTIIGLNRKSSMQIAALLNGMSAHVLELDDGHRKGAVHVGSVVFSALLAVAEHENISCRDFLYGAIIGYEATVRLACAIQPGNKLRGYHATGTCGTIGAALGIAAALHQNFEQMKTTLSTAATSAAGLLEMQEDDSDLKPYNVGRAAMDAVVAAYMGMAGFKAPDDALGGKRGFLRVMTDNPKTEYITDFSAETPLAITQVYRKAYASCRHTHSAIEAAIVLKQQYGIAVENICKVNVETYKLAVAGHDHTDIKGVSSAKMSMPFCVALALCKGSAGMEDFNDTTVTDEEILALTQKVKVVENDELSALVPKKRASILNITMKDGTTISHRVDYPKGEPENPLSDEELEAKFITLAKASGISDSNCKQIIQTINQPTFNIFELLESLHLHTLYNKATH